MIEPEVAPPARTPRRHRRLVVVGVTLLAVVAGGFTVATAGDEPEAEPLALMAGNGAADAASAAERATAPAPAIASAGAGLLRPHHGGWGIEFEVEGALPELAERAPAWRAEGPAVDRAAVARIAGALGLAGSPAERDGGWEVDGGDRTLSVMPGETWSVSLFRGRFGGRLDDSAAGAGDEFGPALSRAEAERLVRDLVERMGAPAGSWKVEITDTEFGTGWGCAAPVPASGDEELKALEAEKLRHLEQPSSAPASPCPPPPAPVKGFNVAMMPLLDGRRADWPVWNVTLRSDGRIENLYGSWVTFERGGDHKLRGVSVALDELRNPPMPEPYVTGGAVPDPETPVAAVDGAPAVDLPSRLPLDGGNRSSVVATPAIDPAPPVCPVPAPTPADQVSPDTAVSSFAPACPSPKPSVVTITGVELSLFQAPVWEDGKPRLHLVPAYRFTGRFEDGTAWETSVVALHRDAIAPPPAAVQTPEKP